MKPENSQSIHRIPPKGVFNPDTGPGDVDHLLPEYEKLLAQIAATRGKLKAQLMEALTR